MLQKFNLVNIIPVIIILMFTIWGFVFPKQLVETLTGLVTSINESVGSIYVFGTAVFVIFCLYLGFGPYKDVKLGKQEDEPEYNYYSWIGLLFGAGMGVGLLFWAVAEPLSHYVEPPPGIEAETQEAADAGLLYSIFHWGIHPWAVYATIALGLAIAKFKKDLPGLISSIFYPLIGQRVHGRVGHTIDILAIVITTIGVATTLGLSTVQLAGGLSEVFGWENSVSLQLSIIAVITVFYLTSVVTGINRGMLYLSVISLSMSAVLMIVVFMLGPTVFLSENIIKMTGQYVSSFVSLTLETTPYTNNQWIGEWTFFYWAWLISWSPFVGTFIARVSRGRTLKQFVFGVLFVPAFASLIWIVTFGGTGLYLEHVQEAGIAETIADLPEAGLFMVMESLPFSLILSIATLVIITIFFVTSANSATYVLGVFASKGDLDPKNSVLITWGLLIAGIAASFLFSGGLDGLEAMSIISAVPFIFLMIVMVFSIHRFVKRDKDY
ncbi:BCCT family transporter [Virgibacillus sp. YIM 98842]|uniref:BCCT family transporter n=1 Tax=Virgibacillus sp. YIM 98842 TaxID=2663533 RepID=UPI001F08FBD6|nr:BCCT family transporter [Virgibacillus sp. YIM 98842]